MKKIQMLLALAASVFMISQATAYTIQNLIDDLQLEPDKSLEIIEDVLIVTPDGVIIFNENYKELRATMLNLPVFCGPPPLKKVLLKQNSGSYEYRWCKGDPHKVRVDVYQFVGGSAYLTQNLHIPCSTPGIPYVVYSQSCP